eukprot:COSAG05_NODE_1752_length_4149_cov_2.831108_2_plen_180_part_00
MSVQPPRRLARVPTRPPLWNLQLLGLSCPVRHWMQATATVGVLYISIDTGREPVPTPALIMGSVAGPQQDNSPPPYSPHPQVHVDVASITQLARSPPGQFSLFTRSWLPTVTKPCRITVTASRPGLQLYYSCIILGEDVCVMNRTPASSAFIRRTLVLGEGRDRYVRLRLTPISHDIGY